MEEYKIRYIDLPHTVKGFTVKDDSEFYNIYINSHLNYEQQLCAIQHELTHIRRNDFYSFDPLSIIENI